MSSRLAGTEGCSSDPPAAAPAPPLPPGVGFPPRWQVDALIAEAALFSALFLLLFFPPFFLTNKVNTRGRFEPLIPPLYSKENKP